MVQTFATLVGAGFILGLMYIANAHNVAAALTFMVCTMACFAMGQAGYWSALQDISPPFAGKEKEKIKQKLCSYLCFWLREKRLCNWIWKYCRICSWISF